MTLLKKTKIELVSEVEKLQRKIDLLKKNKISVPTQFEKSNSIFKNTKWESYFRHSENIVLVIDSKGIILDINKLSKGTKKENVIGKSVYSFVDKETLKTMKLAITNVFKSHTPSNYKSKRINEKGDSFYYFTQVTPLIAHKKVAAIVLEAHDITQEILGKQRLIESEEKFKKLSDSAFEGVAIHKDGKIIEANKALYDTFRYTEKEIVGKPFMQFFHPDFHKTVIENIKNKVEIPYEVIIFRKGGEQVWVEMLGTEIIYKGEPARVVSLRDINKYKENEKRIKESEENHKHFLQEIPSGVIIYVDSIVVFANKAAFEILGLKQKELTEVKNLNIFDYILPKYQIEIKERIKRVLNGEILPFWEIEVQTPTGEILDIEIKSKIVLHNGKKGIQTIFNNISYRKNAEKILKESERTLSTLMNQLPGMAYRCDFDDKWTMHFVSKGAYALTGYKPKDLIDNFRTAFSCIIHPGDRSSEKIKAAIKKKQPYELEYRIIKANGELKWVLEKGEGVFSDDGILLFLEGFILDIDDKKQYEIELQQSRENYKNLVDESPDGIFIFNPADGKVVFANPSAFGIVEINSLKELNNKTVLDFILPEYHAAVKERMQTNYPPEARAFREMKVRTTKGNILELELQAEHILYNGVAAIQVTMHNTGVEKELIKEQLRAQIAEETNQKLQQEIIERKSAERLLQSTQKYTRLLIDSSLDIICASDKNGYVIEFNASAQKTFGYDSDEVIGKHVSMLYEDTEERTRITVELYAKGTYSGEITNIRKNGEAFTAFLSASLLINDEGEIIGTMGVSRDISKIKKAERELRESEEKYRAIYNQAFIGIAQVDMKGKFVQVNQHLCNITGYSQEELYTKTFMDISTPDDIEKSLDYRDKLKSGEIKKATFEKKYIHKNGQIININLTLSLVRDSNGKPLHFISVFQDITERLNVEHEKQAQTAKLKAIFESSSHVIWTANRDFCLTSFNKNFDEQMKRRYGLIPHIGMSLIEGDAISTEEYNNYWINKYQQVFNGNPQYFETKLIDRNKNIVWRDIYLSPIFNEKGKVIEVSGIAHDITEKKISEEQIRQSLQEKEILLKEVHHRVKNNLQVISSILNLQSSYVKDQSTLNILKESQNRIKSMAFIHESLYQTKDFASINFSEYVQNLAHNLMHSYSNVGHDVKLKLDIQNVFLNLDLAIPCGLIINEIVSNALKYAFVDKRNEGEITIKMSTKGEKLQLVIGDNGKGLPPHIDYRNTESLGLQLVVTLIDQLSGTIELNNNNGANFIIIFKHNEVKKRI